ncbi:MAG: T9SS type A sorting domain-containing protein [candidate division Zixibacteria bacterium]|nr:T9SS type A sorting domain-containing protein [candidate division Zixibacteria bacterium]
MKMSIKNALILLIITLVAQSSVNSLYAQDDDAVFIHHSVGGQWLDNSLNSALIAKDYIDERNDIYYGATLSPDSGRPSSLGSVPGDRTDMHHWILWFNDYLLGVKSHGCENGYNRIIMFKSCYPNSNIIDDGTEPGDPFSSTKTTANYKAIYRHPDGPGNTYINSGYEYKPLEDIFAEHPEILFIPVTAPPRHYAPSDPTNDDEAHRARVFNNWLKNDWLDDYNSRHAGYNNVAVFDLFDVIAYPDDHSSHPNRLKAEYGGESGDSHPNDSAYADLTRVFATNTGDFLDTAYDQFNNSSGIDGGKYGINLPREAQLLPNYPNPFNAGTTIVFSLEKSSTVDLSVYNINGQLVEPLIKSFYRPGLHHINWDGSRHSSGVYFIRMNAGDKNLSRRLVLMK